MKIKRFSSIECYQKEFGFMETLKGNPKLKSEMFNAIKSGDIDPDIPEELPDDLKRYMTFLIDNGYENKRLSMGGANSSGTSYAIFSYNSLIDQYLKNKTPFGVRSVKDRRIVLMQCNSFTLSYMVDQGVYAIYEEASSLDLIGRGVNRLFGTSKKPKYTSDSLYTAIDWLFRSIITVHY